MKNIKILGNVITAQGICPHCDEHVILVSIVEDFYRCTNCGEETKQYVNGSIQYLRLDDSDTQWLKNQK